MMRTVLLMLALFLLAACDSDPMVTVYDKKITQTPISCMKLRIFPPNGELRESLERLYLFDEKCRLSLDVSYKCGIKCNSSYNAPQKALSNFPTSYLNMELRKGLLLQYSYYIDLTEKPDADDVRKGFERMQKDLRILPQ